MESGKLEFTNGCIYTSEMDACLTDNSLNENHVMQGYRRFKEYFIRIDKILPYLDILNRLNK